MTCRTNAKNRPPVWLMCNSRVSYVRPQGLFLFRHGRKPIINKWSALWQSLSHCLYLWLTLILFSSISRSPFTESLSRRSEFHVLSFYVQIKRNPARQTGVYFPRQIWMIRDFEIIQKGDGLSRSFWRGKIVAFCTVARSRHPSSEITFSQH